MAVSFGNPLLAFAGIALAALPVVVHLLTRPKPVPLPFSALKFLTETSAARRHRSRLRDALVLGLRTLAVLALGLAVGQLRLAAGRPPGPDDRVDRVVVLDVSRSMNARSLGVAGIDRARALARSVLSGRTVRAGLIFAGTKARPVFDELSVNLGALSEELARARPLPEELDWRAALDAAVALLTGKKGADRRELVIVTDLQRTNWDRLDLSGVPADVEITFCSTAPPLPPRNLAIVAVSHDGHVERGRTLRLHVEVGNFSDLVQRPELEVRVGDRTYKARPELAPWSRRTEPVEVSLPDAGHVEGRATLVGAQDALPDDDARSFVVPVSPLPSIGIVTDQSATRVGTSTYFTYRALAPEAPLGGLDQGRSVIRVAPRDARKEVLEALDVVVLVRAGRLTDDLTRLAAGLVMRGQGLLYVLEEVEDADGLTRLTGELGQKVTLGLTFSPSRRGQKQAYQNLRVVDRRRRPFESLTEGLCTLLEQERFASRMDSLPGGPEPPAGVLARYTDGTVAVAIAETGAGRVGILNMAVASSTLPRSPLFVPFLGELVRALVPGAEAASHAAATGAELSVPLPRSVGGLAGLRALGPDGRPLPGLKIEETTTGVALRGRAASPGIHRVDRKGVTLLALAVECPPSECDLRTVPPGAPRSCPGADGRVRVRQATRVDAVADALDGGPSPAWKSGGPAGGPWATGELGRPAGEASTDLWRYLILASVLFVLAELGVLKLFGT
ncbi:MAG: BatA domain-containing protein [Candidatus Riflebacteria bacterium]|nr:BatA domain-containing protein [Candidatus Riflebacteria bacterium]